MSIFLDTTGQPTLGIGICARCSRKFPLAELLPDPNSPGLMVCRDDRDDLDPYRLPARQTEDINLPFTRPDVDLTDFADPFLFSYILATESGEGILTESGDDLVIEAYSEDPPWL